MAAEEARRRVQVDRALPGRAPGEDRDEPLEVLDVALASLESQQRQSASLAARLERIAARLLEPVPEPGVCRRPPSGAQR